MAIRLVLDIDESGAIRDFQKIENYGEKSAKNIARNFDREAKISTSSFTKFSESVTSQIKGIVTGFIAVQAALNGFRSILNFSKDIETGLAEIATISSSSAKDIAGLKKEILALSTAVPQSAESLIKGYYQALSSGVKEGAEALDLLRVSAKAAVGGLTTADVAIDATTNVINAYGRSVEDAARINDILFTTVKEGKIRYAELAAVIGDIAPTGAALGIGFEELTAALATLTKSGNNFNESATQIRNTMLQIISPTEQARAAAYEYGIQLSSKGIREAGGFVNFLSLINSKLGNNIDALQAIFPEIRAFRGAVVLAGKSNAEFARILDVVNNSVGISDKAFQTLANTNENKLKKSLDSIKVSLSIIGETSLPVATAATESFAEALKALTGQGGASNFFEFAKNYILNLGNLSATFSETAQSIAKDFDNIQKNTEGSTSGKKPVKINSVDLQASNKVAQELRRTIEGTITTQARYNEILIDTTTTEQSYLGLIARQDLAKQELALKQEQLNIRLQDTVNLQNALNSAASSVNGVIGGYAGQLASAVVEGENLLSVLEQIGKELAKRALTGLIVGAATAAFTGGAGFLPGFRAGSGFANGGSFTVPGSPSRTDNTMVTFPAASGERIDITPSGKSRSNNVNLNVTINGALTQQQVERDLVPMLQKAAKKAF